MEEEDCPDPTQLAASQATQATQPTQISRADAEDPSSVRCAVCSMDMSPWSVDDRAVHLNACLDAATLNASYNCPTCGEELTDCDEQQRTAHVNQCLDRLAQYEEINAVSTAAFVREDVARQTQVDETITATAIAATPKRPRDDAETADEQVSPESVVVEYACKICGLDLSATGLNGRIRHIKQCGQRYGIRPSDMASLGHQAQGDAIVSRLDVAAAAVSTEGESAQPNAFSLLMRASATASSALSNAIAGASANVFDVLMRSSKTAAVLNSNTNGNGKKRRVDNNRGRDWDARAGAGAAGRRRLPCPDFKRIRGTSPPFIVDGFQYASKETSSIYFLTHFHSDHYGGLKRSFNYGVIYCNEVTARLVVQELGIKSKFVHPVVMNTPVVVGDVQVTFMDANHCPGAAIILFRLKNGKTYLHTGDFRFNRKMLGYASLQMYCEPSNAGSNSKRLDGVYLDTTYCDPKYVFPDQETTIRHALTLMDKHFKEEKVLFLFGSYSLGKERLFMEVARKFQRKVCVSKAKHRIISTFGWPAHEMQLLTTESSVTNLHVVPMQDLRMDNLSAVLTRHRLRFRQIVAFRPTGWTFSNKSSKSISTCCTDRTGKIHVYGLPYSEHSSFAELCEFIQAANPKLIIPTVNCGSESQVKKQLDALRQAAFHNIRALFQQQ